MNPEIAKALAVAAELTGTELSAPALKAMLQMLGRYDDGAVLAALDRCCRELTGRLTLAAIVERLSDADGRPSPDEAWAIALDAQSEQETVVWNDEIQEAFAVARPVLAAGDKVGARMSFRETYARLVREARIAGRPAVWSASLGWDEDRRRVVLQHAVDTKRLSAPVVAGLLSSPHDSVPLLGSQDNDSSDAQAVERCKAIRQMLAEGDEVRKRRHIEQAEAARAEFERRRAAAIAMAARHEKTKEQASA